MILINAKPKLIRNKSEKGYGLLVILINAKQFVTFISPAIRYGLLVILINAKLPLKSIT